MGATGSTQSSPERAGTADQILDVAQEMIQRRGYDGVSYGDIASALDLTTAAIHYHFPSKADLGRELVARYRRINAEERAAIREQASDLREKFEQYVELYADVLRNDGLCLCGVLASNETTLPEEVRREVRRFFEEQEEWLATVIEEETTNDLELEGDQTARQVAEVFLATVEGALFVNRAQEKDTEAYSTTLQNLIDTIAT